MLERGKMDRDVIEIVGIDSLVPQEHLLRKIDTAVDFSKLYGMVESLYCKDNGRPSIDPVVLFKETIERVFADAKEKHAMRYTQYRGLAQVTNRVKLKFAAMNLKKLAKWKWKKLYTSLVLLPLGRTYAQNPVCA